MEREELMKRALTADYKSLGELGWLEVYEALKGWWPKRMSIEDMAPYFDALHEEPAPKVMATLRGMRGEQWRPSPSALYREIRGIEAKAQAEKDASRDRYGIRKRRDESASALVRVRMMMDSGVHTCKCCPRPVSFKMDHFAVLTCLKCGGIEQGQAFAAEDDLDF